MPAESTSSNARFPNRAPLWRLRTRTLQFGRLPRLMGIVNVTPDSFFDGGKFLDGQAAVDHALRLLDEGADILDIGGESTRPYAAPVSTVEELARVLPVMREVHRLRPDAILSIDTSKPAVAEAALASGAEIINDVTGLAAPEMIALAVRTGAGVCAMHMQGTPQTMQDNPFYDDVVEDIYMVLCQRRDALAAAGIERASVCLDPGIGFGKTHEHNLDLMRGCGRFHDLGCPVLVGHSRKGFIGKAAERASGQGAGASGQGAGTRNQEPAANILAPGSGPLAPEDRLAGTIGGALAVARQGVQVIRVHDVREVREALVLFEVCGGME